MLRFSKNDFALWATQRALSGSVTPELRAVDVKYIADSDIFYFRVYYGGRYAYARLDPRRSTPWPQVDID